MSRTVEETLAHYGVLGMHWGRHLPGRTEASHNPRPTKRTTVSPEHAEAHKLTRHPLSSLSTEEIRKVNKRLQAEQDYKRLNPTTVKKGHDAVKAVLAIAGTATAAAALSKTPAGKVAIGVGKGFLGKFLAGNGKHVAVAIAKSTAKHL